MTRLFLPQTTLEEWAIEDKADLKDGRLVLSEEQASFPVVPAVHVKTLVMGEDAQKLVGKVKTEAQLQALGAEQLADSMVLGDDAYEVDPGYVAELPALAPAAAKPAAAKPPSPDADLLAAFLLNKLS